MTAEASVLLLETASTYVYVDTALGALNRRNHVQRLADIDFKNQSAERYISHRRATSALVEWTRTHTNANGQPTIEGFDGPVWDTSLPFDFDHRTDPGMAQYWVQQFLERLRLVDVPLDALRFYYSGFKGFHVEIPHTLFGGFEPSPELHVWERAAAVELMGSIPFDHAVYDKLRLWRLPNTLNFKGQRYKVQLSLHEISTLSIREIADYLAAEPRPSLVRAPDEDWNPNEYLVEVWARASGRRAAQEQPMPASPAPSWSEQRHDEIFLAGIVAACARSWPTDPAVSRHSDFLLPLSGYLSRQMDAESVAALLKEVARMAGDRSFLDDRTRRWEDEIDRLAIGSAAKVADGQQVEGLPTIAKRWPELADFLSTNFMVAAVAAPAKKGKAESKGFAWTYMDDLVTEPPEETAFLVEGMLPSGGVSLWGAKPKVGKSVAVRNLAVCVARGEPFLGRVCHQGTVLVLCLEEKRAEVANHFRNMGATVEQIHVHVGAAPATSKEGLQALENAITLYQPTLVIVDPVLKLVRVKDSSDYAELTRELEPVIELARKTGCHIAVTHHLGKQAREGGDDVLGSTAIFGAVDTLVLFRRRSDNQRVLQTIQRYGTDLGETVIPMDETGRIALGTAVADLKQAEVRERVLEVLGKLEVGESLDTKELREQTEMANTAVVHALKALMDEALVTRNGLGRQGSPFRYALTEKDSRSAVLLFSHIYPEQQNSRTAVESSSAAEETEPPQPASETAVPDSDSAVLLFSHIGSEQQNSRTAEVEVEELCPVHHLAFDQHDCDLL